MKRIICSVHPPEPAPGGRMVCVEFTDAYTDGSSRHERVYVPARLSRDARLAAIADQLDAPDDAGADIDTVTRRARLEREMDERWAEWQRWKTTREEAQARGMASAIVTALTGRENAAWTAYAQAINDWRLSP